MLQDIRDRLLARKKELDAEVPKHAYDSALALSMKSAGLQEAIEEIDETRERWVKRKYTLDTPPLKLHKAEE